MEEREPARERRERRAFPVEAVASVLMGAAVFAAGRWLAEGSAARAILQTLGATAILLAPVLWRAEGPLTMGLKGVTITLGAREGKRSEAVLSAAAAPEDRLDAITQIAKVPHQALAGIVPFLSGDVSSAAVFVPSAWQGLRLIDPPLQFIRQDLQLSVVAIHRPGERQWEAGGVVSTTPLEPGTELLVCGRASAIEEFRERIRRA
ncbi:MAG TPA: hypothetical protein VII47_08610 [Actinomycetota bacterium]